MGLKVVVTGASSGIGRASTLRFSKDGHEVFATGRNDKKLSETLRLAEAAGGATVYKGIGDVQVEADVQRNYSEAVKAMGQIDVAVLNAGLGYVSPLEDHSVAEFDEIFNTNVRGVFLWLRAILPEFKKRGSGQIVIMNSINGEAPQAPHSGLYTASKYAIKGLADSLRKDLQGSGIKVASVFPGAVDTDIWYLPHWQKSGANLEKKTREYYDLDDALSSEEVANAVASITYQSPKSNIEKITMFPLG